MGNCMYIGHKNIPAFKRASPDHCCIKVLHSCDGRISEFYEQSLKAAELMLEFPNQFLVELEKGNHRPSPISADTDLKPCHAYLLLPMHRMSSSTRISQEQMACFISALSHKTDDASPAPSSAKKSSKGRKPSWYGQSRVTPLVEDVDDGDDDAFRREPSSERSETSSLSIIQKSYSSGPVVPQELRDAMLSAAASSSGAGNKNHLIRRSRSWMPKLETISE